MLNGWATEKKLVGPSMYYAKLRSLSIDYKRRSHQILNSEN